MVYFVWNIHLCYFASYFWYLLHKYIEFYPLLSLEKWKIIFCSKKLKTPFGNIDCHDKMHLCANIGCIIMKGAMDVAIPWSFGLKAKISHTWLPYLWRHFLNNFHNSSLIFFLVSSWYRNIVGAGFTFFWISYFFRNRVKIGGMGIHIKQLKCVNFFMDNA